MILAGRAFRHPLRDKCAGPCEIAFQDRTLPGVMPRNVTVRKDKGIGPD